MNATRRQERMRGAGVHAIDQRHVIFPFADPSLTSTELAIPSSASSSHDAIQDELLAGDDESSFGYSLPSGAAVPPAPTAGQLRRRQERMRGAGTHLIEDQRVPFASPVDMSMTPNSVLPSPKDTMSDLSHDQHDQTTPMARGATVTVSRPIDEKRQQRMRGAGTHAIQGQVVPFASPAESSVTPSLSAISSTDEAQKQIAAARRYSPSRKRQKRNSNMAETRRPYLQALDPELTLQKDMTDAMGEPGDALTIEQRARQRMRGAGTHAIERKNVEFPEMSLSSATASLSRLVAGQDDGDETVMHGTQFQPHHEDGVDFTLGIADDINSDVARASKRSLANLESERSASPSQILSDFPVETLVRFVKLRRPTQQINIATVPMWFIPHFNRSNEEHERAKEEFADVMTLANSFVPGQRKAALRVNDADVTYTLIKREMAKYAATDEGSQFTELFEHILTRLLPLFRKLSEQASERKRLANQLNDAHFKMLTMRRLVYQKRTQVLRIRQAVETIRSQQGTQQQRAQHEADISRFLTQLRAKSATWTSH